mgnify:FL=1
MTIAATINALRKAGVPDNKILDALIEMDEERRAKGRARVAKCRENKRMCNVTDVTSVTSVTDGDAPLDIDEERRPNDGERAAKCLENKKMCNVTSVTDVTSVTEGRPLEERSPTPPKTQSPGNNNITPLISPHASAASEKAQRGTRLPADWEPTAEFINEAIRVGLSFDQAKGEADKFRDYWTSKAGKDAVKLDWLATWRNWCRNAKARASPGGAASRPGYDPRFDPRSGQYDPVLHAKVRSW